MLLVAILNQLRVIHFALLPLLSPFLLPLTYLLLPPRLVQIALPVQHLITVRDIVLMTVIALKFASLAALRGVPALLLRPRERLSILTDFLLKNLYLRLDFLDLVLQRGFAARPKHSINAVTTAGLG